MPSVIDYAKAQLPDYADTYVKDMLAQTQAYTDVNKNPYQQYQGDRVADFSGLQQQAFQGAGAMTPSQYGAQGAGIAGLAANKALSAGQDFTPGTFQGGQFGQPEAQQYMSPYMQSVVDAQQREAGRTADIATTQRNAQATGQGAFGGSRQAIMDAEAGRNLALQKGDIQAKGLQDAFTNAQSQFNTDQSRRLQAEQLGEQSRQYGAGLGLQGANTAMQGATALGNIGNQEFNQNKDVIGQQYLMGTAQQQNQQQGLDVDYQNFTNANQYPEQMLSFRSNMLNGLPMSGNTTTTQTTPDPNGLSQGIGLLGAIGSFFKAEGGAIKDPAKRFAAGGAVGGEDYSSMSDQSLQQAMQFAQRSKDTLTFLALMAEASKRKHTRDAQAMQGPQGEQPTVAEGMMQGVASLPAGNMNFADGGIVAFSGGGDAEDYDLSSPKNKLRMLGAMLRDFGSSPFGANTSGELRRAETMNYGNESKRTSLQDAPPPATSGRDGRDNLSYGDTTKPAPGFTAAPTRQTMELPVGGSARAGASASSSTANSGIGALKAPEWVGSEKYTPKTAEEQDAANRELAKKDDAGLDAIYAPMREREAKKRKDLDERENGKGGYGGLLSPDDTKAMRNAFLAMASGKSANFMDNLVGGATAGAATYDKNQEDRMSRREKLDEAADLRAQAEYAAKQGNRKLAAELGHQAEQLRLDAHKTGVQENTAKNTFNMHGYDTALRSQDADKARQTQLQAARIGASATNRTPAEIQLIERMQKDPAFAKAYGDMVTAKNAPRSNDMLIKEWSGNVILQSQFPNVQDYIRMATGTNGLSAADAALVGKYAPK